MKIRLKDRVANLYHKQQGIPRAGHVLSKPVSTGEAIHDSVKAGWMLKVGFSIRSWKRRFFVLTHSALFYYKSDKSARQKGEILLPHMTEVMEVKGGQHKPNSIAITTHDRVFYAVANDEEDAKEWMAALQSKIALKVGQGRAAMDISVDPESFPPMCQEAQLMATDLSQMRTALLDSFAEGSTVMLKLMAAMQDKFELFEREYGYIAQAQQLAKEIRECLDSCATKLVFLQAEEEALFQATKMRSKANWLKDAIEMGDPEQLARHIQEMRSALSPFKEKYGKQTPVKSVMPVIKEFDALLTRADSALNQIDENLDKLDGIDIIVGKITWLTDAIERGNAQDLERHIQEMKEILSAFEEKHGQDENALPITNQGQKLLAKAERQLVRLQQQRLNGSPMATIPGSPDLELRSPSPVVYTGSDDSLEMSTDTSQSLDVSYESTRGSGGPLSTQVYCSMKHTGKAGKLQKYVVCITCENYDATICLNCRDVCHAGHDVTYEREAECACYCGMGAFSSPCACFVSQVRRKNLIEIDEIHQQVTDTRKARTFVDMVNEISLFPNPDPPTAWADTSRDPCGLIFGNSSKKDQGLTSDLHKEKNMRVVFGKQVILKGMGTEALSEEFTDDDSIYGRVFLPAAPSRIPVSAYPGEDVVYSKVSCFTGIVLYVDNQLWLPPNPSPRAASSSNGYNSNSSPIPSPRRKYTLTNLPLTPLAHSSSRRAHQVHGRSQSHATPVSPSIVSTSPLSSTYHTPTAIAAAASVSAVAAAATSGGVASAVARKTTSRRDSLNRIRRFSFNSTLTSPTLSGCTCNNSNSCKACITATVSPPLTSTTTMPPRPASPMHTTTSSQVVPLLALSTLLFPPQVTPTRVTPHTRGHSRSNSAAQTGPVVGGSVEVPPTVVGSERGGGSVLGYGLMTSPSIGSVGSGGSFYESGGGSAINRVNVGSDGITIVSPITPPNHFFELSMVSGEPQWEWTTYRLMLWPGPNDPDVKIYQTQISNWQKVVMNLSPGTHRIRVEIALGPNPPIRYCVACGEFNYTVTEAHTDKLKKAEQDAVRAEWKDKYTYGTVESDIIGKWVYQMDGSLKCCDGPYTGAEFIWTGDKLEKKSAGLDCVFECFWHPSKHPPELDVHFLPELAKFKFVSLILTSSGVTVSGSVPPPLVTLLAELRFIDREYRQSRAEYELKLAQKKKYEEIKAHLVGRDCPTCDSGQNWLISKV